MKNAPARLAFSKRRLEELIAPAAGRVYYYDVGQPGLCLCITANDRRSYYVYRKIVGRPVRYRLGTFADLTVEQARNAAKALTGEIVQGIDPQRRKQESREELTFGELFGRWMEYSREHKRTWKEDQRKYDKFLLPWGGRPLSAIDDSDVERLHHAVKVKSGPYQANRVLELVKAMFRRGINSRIWNGRNPAATAKKFREHSRERFLRPDEVAKFFEALESAPLDLQHLFVLLLLTGQRRGTVQAMRWADVDLQACTWAPPSPSAIKRAALVPLVPRAVEVLRDRLPSESEWVFPADSESGHIMEPKKEWAALRKAAKLDGLRMHDLRRTLGSWQASNGVSLAIIGKSLGHAAGSRATSVYARLDLDPVRKAVTDATTAILAASKPKRGRKGASNG